VRAPFEATHELSESASLRRRTYTAPVSDTSKSAPEPKPSVELTKKTKPPVPDTVDNAGPPRSIVIAFYAICAQIGLSVLYAVLSWPLGTQLHKAIVDNNKKAKPPKTLCEVSRVKGCLDVSKTVHTLQIETSVITAVVALVVVLMLQRIRRGTRSGRSAYIVVSVVGGFVGFAGSPFSLLVVASGGPTALRVDSAAAAAASILAIVVLFRPDSKQFFDLMSPRVGATGAAPRPGLGSLFRPRPPVERKPQPTAGARPTTASPAERRLAKAKTRNDAEAVARGAALARGRAKASKSRRTDI
jgi:hypothetical protein